VSVPSTTQVGRLKAAIAHLPPADFRLTHHFADGIYGRELFIPAGTALVGERHTHSTLNILLQGRIHVTGADGAVREMVAPAMFVSSAGTEKVGFAVEDTIWVNVHPTKLTDLDAIRAKFIEPGTPALESEGELWLGSQ
jgi:hypothetical protein